MKQKYLKTTEHFRQVLAESINALRTKKNLTKLDIEKYRAIGYLSSIGLSAIKQGEIEERLIALEEKLNNE